MGDWVLPGSLACLNQPGLQGGSVGQRIALTRQSSMQNSSHPLASSAMSVRLESDWVSFGQAPGRSLGARVLEPLCKC